jgi:hypothetical protein
MQVLVSVKVFLMLVFWCLAFWVVCTECFPAL